MNTIDPHRHYTPEDLLLMQDGPRFDLIDGQLVERGIGTQAIRVATIILTMLSNFEQGRSLGFSFDSECGYQIFGRDQKNVRFPDGSFVARGKFPGDILPLGYARVVPDLVFEVVSPNDLAEEVDQKVEDYLQVGVRLIWVVYPATRRVVVFRPEGRAARLGGAQEITGEDVLPGFSCRVEQFFAGIGT